MIVTSPTDHANALSAEQLRAIDVHAALDRSQDCRRSLRLADVELDDAVSAFDAGLDEHVDSRLLSMLDADVEVATAAQAFAVWNSAESEVALIGAAGQPIDSRVNPAAQHHSASFPPSPRAVSQVRALLRGRLEAVADEDMIADVELMASEVATNCIRYENPGVLAVELDIRRTSSRQTTITVTVSGGHAEASDALMQPTNGHTPDAESGRGLGILDSLAQVWGTQRRHRRTAVWFSVTAATPGRGRDQDVVAHTERAAAVLADACAIAAEAEAQVLREYEDAARVAADLSQAAVETAARATARAVDTARRSRACAAAAAAAAVAHLAESSARAVAQRVTDADTVVGSDIDLQNALAAAVVADAVAVAAMTARELDTRAARTDARRAARAADMVREVADVAAYRAAQASEAHLRRIRTAATARRRVYGTPLVTSLGRGSTEN